MGNGAAERFNQSLLMLRCLSEDRKRKWREYLPAVVHAYNSSWSAATGFSPHYLMFGRQPRLPVDLAFGVPSMKKIEKNYPTYVQELKKKLTEAYKLARSRTDARQERQKASYDNGVRGACLLPGDIVLVKKNVRDKLDNFWEDEKFEVVGQQHPDIPVYQVKPINSTRKTRTVHRNQLLPIGSIPTEAEIERHCGTSVTSDRVDEQSGSSSSEAEDSSSTVSELPQRRRKKPQIYDPSKYM